MTEKIFIEKYPEFKDLISFDEECETNFVAVGLIEVVLDKHFTKNTETLPSGEYVPKKMYDEYKQKVKDAIETAWYKSGMKHREKAELLKGLGLEK